MQRRTNVNGACSLTLRVSFQPDQPLVPALATGLDPEQARAADVVRLLASDPEEAMNTPTLACFAIDGLDGLTWALMATFDHGSLKLQTLTLQRSGDWVAATVDPVTASAAGPDAAQARS